MKTAVITGSSYGLGKSITDLLLKNNFKIYGISRTQPEIKNTNFIWIKADLLVDESFNLIKQKVGENKIDLLVNCAGVVFAEESLEFTKNTFDKTFGINLIAPIKLTSILKNKLKSGTVINISSTSDRFAEDSLGMYCASKSALDIYFDSVAIENKNIKVLTILPVYIDTPMLKNISEKLKFTTDDAIKPEITANAIFQIVNSKENLDSGSRIIILSNKSLDEVNDPEKLYYYNVDIDELKKVK